MTVSVTATASSTTRYTLSLHAALPISEADPVPGNNCATDTATVTTSANLSITKSHTPTSEAHKTDIHTIMATNSRPSSATNNNVTDSVPAGITVTAATTTQGSCAPPPPRPAPRPGRPPSPAVPAPCRRASP